MDEYFVITQIIILFFIGIVVLIWCILLSKKDGEGIPFDDSNLANNYFDNVKTTLYNFLGNREEAIVGALGINNAVSNENLYEKGLCFVTDKAYYFIGKVWQKKSFFSWKSNIQYRIVITEMNAIRIKTLYPWYGVILLIYMVIFIMYVAEKCYTLLQWDANYYSEVVFLLLVLLIIPTICIISYGVVLLYAKRKTTIDIEFTKQVMRFPVNQLGKQEIKDFYKAVSQVQKKVNNDVGNEVVKGNVAQQSVVKSSSKVESLGELSKLYEQKLINQEEFERLKQEILNGN